MGGRERAGRGWPRRAVAAVAVAVLSLTAGCAQAPADSAADAATDSATDAPSSSGPPTASPSAGASPSLLPAAPTSSPLLGTPGPTAGPTDHTVPAPGPLTQPLAYADLLIYGQRPISARRVARIRDLDGVTGVEQVSLSQVAVQDKILQVAAVDPATYRRYNPPATAHEQEVWARVAGGEVAIVQRLGERLQDEQGMVRLGNDADAPVVHIGAYAPQVKQVDAVVNRRWGQTLGMPAGNALLVATGVTSPQSLRPALERIAGGEASVQILAQDIDVTVDQTAVLTGGSVAEAVGTFSYEVIGGGRIAPDPAWVAASIRTEDVPILGRVTCHRVMLPQLRAALTEVVVQGLADKIHPDEYAGCYYPRFIAGTTQLSLHSFGIALDMNVPGNLRGTVGEFDRRVVAIFKKWGFSWGGDWNYTDPMHFELASLVAAR